MGGEPAAGAVTERHLDTVRALPRRSEEPGAGTGGAAEDASPRGPRGYVSPRGPRGTRVRRRGLRCSGKPTPQTSSVTAAAGAPSSVFPFLGPSPFSGTSLTNTAAASAITAITAPSRNAEWVPEETAYW